MKKDEEQLAFWSLEKNTISYSLEYLKGKESPDF